MTRQQAATQLRLAIVTHARYPNALNARLIGRAREEAREAGVDVERVEATIRRELVSR